MEGGVDRMDWMDVCGKPHCSTAPVLESRLRRGLRGQRPGDLLSFYVSCLRRASESSGDENFSATA